MIGSRMLGLAALAIIWAAPASAQTITLAAGQATEIHIDARGAQFRDTGAATLSPYDLHAITQLRGATKAGQFGYTTLQGSDDAPPAIVPDTIHIRFVSRDGESVLILDNGYAQGMTYRARMTLEDGRTLATDVCLVRPGRLSYEYWPHAVVKIELTSFALTPWNDGDKVPCV